MFRTTLLALLAGTFLVTGAVAQTETPERAHPILRLDTDGDGQISRAEAEAGGGNPLARADANGDGQVTRAEAVAMAAERASTRATERAGAMFDRFDENGDGVIAVENLPEPRGDRGDRGDRMARMFDRADANDDGVLSAAEIEDLPERGPRGGKGRGHGGHGGRR